MIDWKRDFLHPSVNVVNVWDRELDPKQLMALANAVKAGDIIIPHSYEQAMKAPESWGPVMKDEISNLEA